jgi:hypothetical protein
MFAYIFSPVVVVSADIIKVLIELVIMLFSFFGAIMLYLIPTYESRISNTREKIEKYKIALKFKQTDRKTIEHYQMLCEISTENLQRLSYRRHKTMQAITLTAIGLVSSLFCLFCLLISMYLDNTFILNQISWMQVTLSFVSLLFLCTGLTGIFTLVTSFTRKYVSRLQSE